MPDLTGLLSNMPSGSLHTPGGSLTNMPVCPRLCEIWPHHVTWGIIPTLTTLGHQQVTDVLAKASISSHSQSWLSLSSHCNTGIYANVARRPSFPTSGCFQAQSIKSRIETAPSASMSSPHQVPKLVHTSGWGTDALLLPSCPSLIQLTQTHDSPLLTPSLLPHQKPRRTSVMQTHSQKIPDWPSQQITQLNPRQAQSGLLLHLGHLGFSWKEGKGRLIGEKVFLVCFAGRQMNRQDLRGLWKLLLSGCHPYTFRIMICWSSKGLEVIWDLGVSPELTEHVLDSSRYSRSLQEVGSHHLHFIDEQLRLNERIRLIWLKTYGIRFKPMWSERELEFLAILLPCLMGRAGGPGCRKRRVSKMLKFKVIRGLCATTTATTTAATTKIGRASCRERV